MSPLSHDPIKREAQLANLRPSASRKHEALSERALAPLRAKYRIELTAAFPHAASDEINIQASRLAMMERLQEWLDARGPISHQRRGTTYPAADLLAKVVSAYERRRDVLAERERAYTGANGAVSLAAIVAEYEAKDEAAA